MDSSGVDMMLVGDCLAMVQLGYYTMQPATMDMMLLHAQAVAR